jgi:hypothetical protein
MYTPAFLLTSVLTTAYAFVPMHLYPPPSELDNAVWVPLTTIDLVPTATPSIPTSQITPAPTPSSEIHALPALDANIVPELRVRQVTGQGPAVAATAIQQVSPVTTVQLFKYVNGVAQQVAVVYTQTFGGVPDQWPAPTVGTIGLGTIQGDVGQVKTKRSLPTQVPMGGRPDFTRKLDSDEKNETVSMLEKVKKVGEKLQSEMIELLKTEKTEPATQSESTANSDRMPEGLVSETGARHAKQLLAAAANDARALKAGMLAVLAVSIGTMCISLV